MAKISSLFIGRFQPFHRGHIADVKMIIEKGEFCIIAIAAANKNGTVENPLTAQEREKIILATLGAQDIDPQSYIIKYVPDIDNDVKWVAHVRECVPAFEKIYSGSKWTLDLFEKDGKHEVVPLELLRDAQGRIISATLIREKILQGDSTREYLHPRTEELLQKFRFTQRL